MKKFTLIFTLGLFASLMGIMSCGDGGSDEDRQQAIQDSIRQADSLAALAAASLADSIAYADSVRIADSLAAIEGAPRVPSKNNGNNNNGGGNETPVEPTPVETPTDNGVKPGKNDRGGDGKTGTVKPSKRNR